MTGQLHAMWIGFEATWPIWLFAAALATWAVWAAVANDRAKRRHRRDRDVYVRVTLTADTRRLDEALTKAQRAARRAGGPR